MPEKVGPAIAPRVLEAKRYERAITRWVVDPVVTETRARMARAAADYEALRDSFPRLDDLPDRSDRVARAELTRMQERHRRDFHSRMGRALGVDVREIVTAEAVRPLMEEQLRENVALIKTIGPRYHDGLRKRLEKALFEGAAFDQQQLSRMFREQYRLTGYDVRRLARDQTNKTIGRLNGARQQQVGVEEYIWQTAGDHRVRETHEELNDTRQKWSVEPFVGHPGSDIQCRCVALPVIPERATGAARGRPAPTGAGTVSPSGSRPPTSPVRLRSEIARLQAGIARLQGLRRRALREGDDTAAADAARRIGNARSRISRRRGKLRDAGGDPLPTNDDRATILRQEIVALRAEAHVLRRRIRTGDVPDAEGRRLLRNISARVNSRKRRIQGLGAPVP